MASNNYAVPTGDRAIIDDADMDKVFVILTDVGKQRYNISCFRESNLPPLPDVEEGGLPISGFWVKMALEVADESEILDYGNGHRGIYMRHGDEHSSVVQFCPYSCQSRDWVDRIRQRQHQMVSPEAQPLSDDEDIPF